jgi:hypothetical protein
MGTERLKREGDKYKKRDNERGRGTNTQRYVEMEKHSKAIRDIKRGYGSYRYTE